MEIKFVDRIKRKQRYFNSAFTGIFYKENDVWSCANRNNGLPCVFLMNGTIQYQVNEKLHNRHYPAWLKITGNIEWYLAGNPVSKLEAII